MKKVALTFVAFLMAVLPAFAENVTVQTAQRAAESFLNSKMEGNLQIQLIDFAEKSSFPNFYVFGNERCFVIIAADDCVHPVLGYSTEGGFSTDMLHESVHYWLKTYDEAIGIISENRVEATPEIRLEWDNILNGKGLESKSGNSVKQLIRTEWGQQAPYNAFCPADTTGPNGHAVAGCIAIAMAQIMNYWEHPVKGVGSHTYIPKTHPEYGEQSANFGETVYAWNNMAGPYYAQEQKEAVATLVYHCGVAVDMNYGPASQIDSMGSGASSNDVVKALQRYFHYDSGMELKYRSYYSEKKWISMLKKELDAERPVYYAGMDTALGGHAFVCDGYDEDEFFHFNWGWYGVNDGYFLLKDLNPGIFPTFHFNNQVHAIFGCEPIVTILSPTDVMASVDMRDVTINWNTVNDAISYKLYRDGVLVADSLTETVYYDNDVVYGEHGYYVKSVGFDGTTSLKSNTAIVNISCPVPFAINLNASIIDNDVSLSWSIAEPEDAILQYGSDESVGTISYPYCAQLYPKSILYNYAGMVINKVSVYFSQSGLYELFLYKGDIHYSFSSELLYQIDYYAPYSGWQEIEFDDPVSLDYLRDLWVVLFSKDGMGHVSCCEYDAPNVSNAAYYSTNGKYWYQLAGSYSWLIKTHLTDGTHSYNIYRDGEVVTSNYHYNTYTDLNLSEGNYVYYVTSNYSGGESTPSNEKIVFIGNPQLFALVKDGKLLVICSDSNYENYKDNKVEVIDITGRVIISDVFKSKYERSLDLKPGVYVIRLIKNKTVKTQKIVIN